MGRAQEAKQGQAELFEVVHGFEELNLVECPLALLSRRPTPGASKTLRFEDQIQDSSSGELVTRRWTVSAADSLPGPPTASHMDVLLALFRITAELGCKHQTEIPFTVYQICQTLLWPPKDGRYAKTVKDALRQWTGTFIQFENSFRRNGKWTSEKGFNLISWYELALGEDADPDNSHKEQVFMWNPKIVESISRDYVKKLNLEFYLRLESAVSKRLYRLLDKRFHNTDFYMPRLRFTDFCTEKIGMARSYRKPAKYRERLQPALDELVAKGFLSQAKYVEHNGVEKLQFRKGRQRGKRKSLIETEKRGNGLKENENAAISVEEKLVACGVRAGREKKQAGWLADKFEAEKIERCIEHWKRLNEELPEGNHKGAGYLIASITTDDERGFVPKEFKTKKDRKKELEAKKQQKEKQRRTELQARAKEQWINKDSFEAFTRARELFPPEKREQAEEDALRRANAIVRDGVLREREEGMIGLFHRMLWEGEILPEYADEVESVWNPEDEERRAEQETRFEETDRRVRTYLSGLSVSEYAKLEEAAAQNVSGELAGRIKSVEDIRRSPFGWAAVMSYVEQRLDAVEGERHESSSAATERGKKRPR